MEARIASLEAHMVHVSKAVDKLGDVPERLVALETKVDALPTKDYVRDTMRNWIIGAVAFMTLVTILFEFIKP